MKKVNFLSVLVFFMVLASASIIAKADEAQKVMKPEEVLQVLEDNCATRPPHNRDGYPCHLEFADGHGALVAITRPRHITVHYLINHKLIEGIDQFAPFDPHNSEIGKYLDERKQKGILRDVSSIYTPKGWTFPE